MKVSLRIILVLFVGLAVAGGCNKPDDNALIWQRADLEHEGYVISLGHHGEQLYADHKAEPAVMITRDGEPVADAMVFVTLLDSAGEKVLTQEQATVYKLPTDAEPAYYSPTSVMLPADATEVTLRYRITFPEAGEFSQDVVIPVVKH